MSNYRLEKKYKRGSKGKKVKLIQEWLCHHGYNIVIDSNLGAATEYAIKQFQKKKKLKINGIVDNATFNSLIQPLTSALKPLHSSKKSLRQMIVYVAKQHLKQHPHEIGGQNHGPWVRLYMNGQEGRNLPWCAGFVSFILRQSCDNLKMELPLTSSCSCDRLAVSAKKNHIFLKGAKNPKKEQIKPGIIFLNRKNKNDWNHTGIIIKTGDDIFHSIEGNTNDMGSREGYEVCRRIRSYKNKDYILI